MDAATSSDGAAAMSDPVRVRDLPMVRPVAILDNAVMLMSLQHRSSIRSVAEHRGKQ